MSRFKVIENGDMFALPQDYVLVDPVNTLGVSGAGLAKVFKQMFPEAVRDYERWCKKGYAKVGRIHFVETNAGSGFARYIAFLPTKTTWRMPSELSYVKDGLDALVELAKNTVIPTISIPSLGAGLGGLAWDDVRPLIEDAARRMPSSVKQVRIFAPL